jgi:hypothetical protein
MEQEYIPDYLSRAGNINPAPQELLLPADVSKAGIRQFRQVIHRQ